MSKSNKYGYSGVDIPTQAVKANVGKFDPSEINELVQEDKWTQYGQLELILTSTASTSTIDFVDKFSSHDVHLVVLSTLIPTTQTEFGLKLSNDSGSSYETTNYEFANQRCFANGTFEERKSTSQSSIRLGGDVETSDNFNGYFYIYNANDSSKYTFITSHSTYTGTSGAGGFGSSFGSGVYKQAETVNGIRIGQATNATSFTSGTASLYGIKEYS